MSWLIAVLLTATVWNVMAAEPAAPSPMITAASSSSSRHEVAPPRDVAGWGPSIDSAALAKFSGGTDVTETMTLNGTVANNRVDHVVNGANVISSGSFTGAMGLPMVIQNSGNAVLIQNATIVNVQFQP
ncbi:hypothetical protein [Rhodanobacter glycinis]|uniref:hypothetical protein n=1 Tax=Rhodanobacter glycinis TaxID=582702 RepID=UPI001EFFFC0D|nr:hypothetical protein [Rhodanobacter glycinis]